MERRATIRWRAILTGACLLSVCEPAVSLARSHCEAAAQNRRVAGTVLGAVGGAVIGNQISHSGGTVVGGLVGGFAGNQLSKTHCYHPAEARRHSAYEDRNASPQTEASSPGSCAMQDKPFYDARGDLVHRQVQVCR
jgi:uncharacterized protein YcfJ